MIKISRGLDVPISGSPEQSISDAPAVQQCAVVGFDYPGLKPTMAVKVGDRVKTGQLLFTDKKTEGVRYTAPCTGVVSAIHRGAKRVFQSIVIDVEADEFESFAQYNPADAAQLTAEQVKENLVNSGLWTALRTRPFSKVPATDTVPAAIFVNAMDTNPLAANPEVIIAESKDDFEYGLKIVSKLTEGKTWLSKAAGANIPTVPEVQDAEFAGKHPAGLTGTHIHFLDPVSESKKVWSINYQDVIAVGQLFKTGQLPTSRVIALAGPVVEQPRLLRTRLGASIDNLVAGQLAAGENRAISGSVLSGRTARGALAFLGRYHLQVSVLAEGVEREFMGWFSPGFNKFSLKRIYATALSAGKSFAMTTTTNGSPRAIVPIGSYEKIMPLDILPTQLLRAIVTGDLELAQSLGALELEEEDLALCTFVCPGKYEYGPILRDVLTRIEKEG